MSNTRSNIDSNNHTNDSVDVKSTRSNVKSKEIYKIYRKKVQADNPKQTKKCKHIRSNVDSKNHISKKHKKPKFSKIYDKFIITFD